MLVDDGAAAVLADGGVDQYFDDDERPFHPFHPHRISPPIFTLLCLYPSIPRTHTPLITNNDDDDDDDECMFATRSLHHDQLQQQQHRQLCRL